MNLDPWEYGSTALVLISTVPVTGIDFKSVLTLFICNFQ